MAITLLAKLMTRKLHIFVGFNYVLCKCLQNVLNRIKQYSHTEILRVNHDISYKYILSKLIQITKSVLQQPNYLLAFQTANFDLREVMLGPPKGPYIGNEWKVL